MLEPVVARYRDRTLRRYFRGDAAFASPEVYEFLETEGMLYAIRLPANKVLQESIAHLLKRPVGRPPKDVRRYHASFSYQAGTWNKPRRVVAKVEWHPGEFYPRGSGSLSPTWAAPPSGWSRSTVSAASSPRSSGIRVSFTPAGIVTNLGRPAERVVAFYSQRPG